LACSGCGREPLQFNDAGGGGSATKPKNRLYWYIQK